MADLGNLKFIGEDASGSWVLRAPDGQDIFAPAGSVSVDHQGNVSKPREMPVGIFGKALGAVGLDGDGRRGATSWPEAWENTWDNRNRQGVFAPVSSDADGKVSTAVPAMISAPLDGFERTWERGGEANVNNPEALRQSVIDSFDAAGGAMTGGLVAGMAGSVPKGAITSNSVGRGGTLATDEASRLARAKELGFDTDKTWYHGSGDPITEFDPSRVGSRLYRTEHGFYFSENRPTAQAYADVSNIQRRDHEINAAESRNAAKRWWEKKEAEPSGPMPTYVHDVYVRPGKQATIDFEIGMFPQKEIGRLKDEGYDSVIVRGMPDGEFNPDGSFPHELVVFDPKNIRRTDATFDPSRVDSANLLAANAPTGVSLPLAFNEKDEFASGGRVTLEDFIAQHEGYSPTPYWDYAQYTSGYGTRARSPNERIDEAEARRRLSAEVAQARSIVDRFAPNLDEGTKQALTSLTFNAGDKWTRSGLGRAIQSGNMDQARSLFVQYNKAGGQTLPGLVSRRKNEVALFGNPLSGAPQQATGGDFFASAPIGLTGNELPPLGAERPQMMALGGPKPETQPPTPEPFNARSYKVHPESAPDKVEWMSSPLGLVPKWSDGQTPLQAFKDGGRVKGLGAIPTEAQKEAGNYKKGHIKFQGLAVSIENPKGSERSGTGEGGKRWSVKMPADYGYFKRTRGRDGDHVDCYVGPDEDAQKAYVIDQIDAETGKFDEHKVMIGFPGKDEALSVYEKAFNDGRGKDRIGNVRSLSIVGLKEWLASGDTTKPIGPQKLASGGVVGGASRNLGMVPFHAGALRSEVAGRTDHLPLEVSEGSFVIPADVVSSLGQGNTEAGIKVLDEMFPKQLQTLKYAAGGRVPILAAGGEYVLSPEQVAVIGAGDLSAGHDALDAWVVRQRGNTIKTLQQLPGPAK